MKTSLAKLRIFSILLTLVFSIGYQPSVNAQSCAAALITPTRISAANLVQEIRHGQLNMIINTSNAAKQSAFNKVASDAGITTGYHKIDLNEPDSDPNTIANVKAIEAKKQLNLPGKNIIIIEDTALHVQGAQVGANIKWMLNNLNSLGGRKAVWEATLAFQVGDQVYIYKGEIRGRISSTPKGEGPGFAPYLIPDLPNGKPGTLSLAQIPEITPRSSAQMAALTKFVSGLEPDIVQKAISDYQGKWQQ